MTDFLIRKLSEYPTTEKMLARLPQWRRAKALSYAREIDRRQSAAAYLLLRELLAMHGSDTEEPFVYSENGKPSFVGDGRVAFSISHCAEAVACAVSDEGKVGCDVESVPVEVDFEVCVAVFDAEEISAIGNSANPPLEFTRLWTLREARAKLLDTDLQSPVLSQQIAGEMKSTVAADGYAATFVWV